jgi:peptidase M15
MGSLADIFTSYKTLEESANELEETEAPQNTVTGNPEIKSRLQSFIENTRKLQESENNSEEVISESSPEISTEDKVDFAKNWFGDFLNIKPFEIEKPSTTSEDIPSTDIVIYNRGHLDQEIKKLFAEEGINIRVTSGKRSAGSAGKAGSKSHHIHGNAADIVPGEGETFESIKRKMQNSEKIKRFFYENGLGIIDETDPNTMKKTGATGKHFHVGPDQLATKTWTAWIGNTNYSTNNLSRQQWARTLNTAFETGLKEKFGNRYSQSDYKRIAKYMTYQAALESGYGKNAKGFNYAGHMSNGKVIKYNSLSEFVQAHLKTLDKWDYMQAKSLKDYVNSLYQGSYRYNTSDSPNRYYSMINGTSARINSYLGNYSRLGGILGI